MPRVESYLRGEELPHVWCAGCGNGTIVRELIQAVDQLGWSKDKVAVIGGIGCSGRTPFILDFNTMHTTHGRALAFATGVKLARPELHVVVTSGDGDTAGIGGNHFIHACRRNIDLTLLVFNNGLYGQTGGQLAPTTPVGARTATTRTGNIDPPFDIAQLALAAGASFVARTTTFDNQDQEMERFIQLALAHRGFSLVEVLCQCPTYFGRMNGLGDPHEMLFHLRDETLPLAELPEVLHQWEEQVRAQTVSLEQAKGMLPEELAGKSLTGIFCNEDRPEYTKSYQELQQSLQEQHKKAGVA